MDRLKLKVSAQELSELHEVLDYLLALFTPGAIRSEAGDPLKYATVCMIAIVAQRLQLRIATLALRVRKQHPLNVPAEEGHALIILWLGIPGSALPKEFLHARNCIGRIQQALA